MSAAGRAVIENAEPLDLIVLDDGGRSVTVRLPSPAPRHGCHAAGILIRGGFVNAAVRIGFDADALDDRAALLAPNGSRRPGSGWPPFGGGFEKKTRSAHKVRNGIRRN
ncbi:hypothetical protein ACWD3J_23735 [Streptomyces sp. NPDC002755]|uniref:hypothetical protein n=1 Tax=Streptomyces sp. NPDC002884 TaxID=3154544 RepID=UPI0033263193